MTVPWVVKEFLQCHIAPLQHHSRLMWALTGDRDRMRLHETKLAPEMLRMVLEVLTGDPSPGDIRHGGSLLYLCSGGAEFARQMPHFDKWGLRPAGLAGPRKNPVAVAPFPIANTDLALGGGAGRQASLVAGGSGVEMLMSRGALEAPFSRACDARPEVVVYVEARPTTPEAGVGVKTSGSRVGGPELCV